MPVRVVNPRPTCVFFLPASVPPWWWEWDRDLTTSSISTGSGFEATDPWVWLGCFRLVFRQGSAVFPLSWLAAACSGVLQPVHGSWPWAALIRVRYSLAWGNVFLEPPPAKVQASQSCLRRDVGGESEFGFLLSQLQSWKSCVCISSLKAPRPLLQGPRVPLH